MSIVVTKCSPEVVGPCEAGTPAADIRLSSFDKYLGSVPVPLLLVFDKPIHDPVDTIRRALSRALVHYYPVSGRLAVGSDGSSSEVITCTGGGEGQGVLFVSASVSCAVGDVLLPSSPLSLLNDLFLRYPEVMCRHADPLLLMQVTVFSCGGFAIGVTWNHVLADGAGMGQFLQAMGELARGMSLPSVVPVRSDESVLLGGVAASAMDYTSAVLTHGMAFLDFTIPSSFISRVKNALGKSSCSTVFEVAVALLWQCRARAVLSSDSSSSPAASSSLIFGYNMRGLVGSVGGYYGNCLIQVPVVATSAEVANGDLKDVVRLIQVAKKKIQDNKLINNGDVVQLGYNTLLVSSWRNLGLESPDFGGGRPARVMWYQPRHVFPFFVMCPPCQWNYQGVNVLGYLVKKEHVDAFTHHMSATCGQDVIIR